MLKKLKPIQIGEHINLHMIQTDKFKTNLISVYFQRPLKKEEVTQNALLSMILPRGTKTYPTSKEIAKVLEYLYGSYIGCDVAKKGERNILQFFMKLPNGNYIEDPEIFQKGMNILNEFINDPYITNGLFKKDYVNQEKENLKEKIEGRKNDKMKYAYDRCVEEMCKDENYALYVYGSVEELEKLSEEELYRHYQEILHTSVVDICVVGDFNPDNMEKMIKENIKIDQKEVVLVEREKIEKDLYEVKLIKEPMDVNQGKLSLGYRTNIPFESELYQPLIVYSNILGGGANSKLFRNIREKESLCYYIYSRVDKFKSLMLISSGIEFENYEKTLSLVKEQVSSMNKGEFSQEDIESAKNSIITSIRSMTDSPYMLSDFYYTQAISHNEDTIEEMIEKIRSVTKEDIIKVGQNIKLDTIYFLTGKEEVK
ncbi:EF-P 5-aminopentanol modification-associated protein YfmF [Inediibacterium massiliense]|uniref:EF-P 5-aminopentanol modification-associated protein YfmF n=1 Tax=Inediibacterium massiliense TaxID=1658111 RepID=UPI0006B53AC9|nr:pitrilysin family protein [Inediibacterium massiliense]